MGKSRAKFGTSEREYYFLADPSLARDDRYRYSGEEYYWAAVRDAVITPVLLANEWIPIVTHKVTIQERWLRTLFFGIPLVKRLRSCY
jgi:hypothetical protein